MGLVTLGSHKMDLGVCMHALHKMQTNTGIWLETFQNYDKHNVNKDAILWLPSYIL